MRASFVGLALVAAVTVATPLPAEPDYSHQRMERACEYFAREAFDLLADDAIGNFEFSPSNVFAGTWLGRYKKANWLDVRVAVGSPGETRPGTEVPHSFFEPEYLVSFSATCTLDVVDKRVLRISFRDGVSAGLRTSDTSLDSEIIEGVDSAVVDVGSLVHGGKY